MSSHRPLAFLVAVASLLACTPEPAVTTAPTTTTVASAATATATATPTTTPTPTGNATGPTCDARVANVNSYLETNRKCAKVEDCVLVTTPCGTNGICGAYIRRGAEDGLNKLSTELGNCPPTQPCPSCSPPMPAACVGGVCTVR